MTRRTTHASLTALSPAGPVLTAGLVVAGLLAAGPFAAGLPAQEEPQVLDERLHHLGDTRVSTWEEVPADPEGTRLDLTFNARRNPREQVLSIHHRDVDERWSVRINGKEFATLKRGKELLRHLYTIPPGTLVNGRNELSLVPAKTSDDIVVGRVRLHLRTLREVLHLQQVRVEVRDDRARPLPAKVTITGRDGGLSEHYYGAGDTSAVREGVAYTSVGAAAFELPPGDYEVWATRGTEWSLDHAPLSIGDGPAGTVDVPAVSLRLTREVETRGFVAADTHIHTLTHSGHGDSSVEERMVTLAGEGVELAIATDHNHNIDYRPTQKRMKLGRYFTPVTGNEVTTKVGHMNAFPLDPRDPVPNHKLKDWIQLVDGIRKKGAKVVILNHPRWPRIPTGPFGEFGLDRLTGALPGQGGVPFDAMELVNSGTLQNDPLFLFVDWFALLNHGHRITAVGTSDSHTVGDPVGQGRTYVRSSTDDPARIRVNEVCEAFQRGDTTVSLGIFCDIEIDGRHHMGDVAPATDREVGVALRVAAASWVRPRLARVFVNGVEAHRLEVPVEDGQATNARLELDVPLPPHDAHVVCVVTGDGISGAFWRTQKPYTLAATNPVWLDVDGDRRYSSPRKVAEKLVKKHGAEPDRLRPALANVDDAVGVQLLDLAWLRYGGDSKNAQHLRIARRKLEELIGQPATRDVFARFLKTRPPVGTGGGGGR